MSFLLIMIMLITVLLSDNYHEQVEAYRQEQQENFRKKKTSPLKTKAARKHFKGISYYPVDIAYKVQASFTPVKDTNSVVMPTSAKKTKTYRKYGALHFTLEGKSLRLFVYQNLKLLENPVYKNHLFIPFRDLTSGETSYGGGRYIDMELPLADTVILDFNYAYNPYCAYTDGYNCPIPPPENFLEAKIEAGPKAYTGERY